jgi:Domain of unknown function (DUF4157)
MHGRAQTVMAPPAATRKKPAAPAPVVDSFRGGGQPLPGSVRSFFEPRFGRDFSDVRVHFDSRANEAASAVQARAFTLGRDVVFDTGQYAPQTEEGQRLLAHELAHVAQQGQAARQPQIQRSPAPAAGAVPASGPTKPRPYFEELLEEIRANRLKGTETAGLFTLVSALTHGLTGVGGERFGREPTSSALGKYLREIALLTPSESPLSDPISLALRASIGEYAASPQFRARAGKEWATLLALVLAGQAIYSAALPAVQALFPSKPGQLTGSQGSSQAQYLLSLVRLAAGEYLKPPGAFSDSRISLGTHPLYIPDFLGGPPPSGVTIEEMNKAGEPGYRRTFGGTLNIAKLFKPKGVRPKEMGDLGRFRGLQGTVWGVYDASTLNQQSQTQFKVGGIAGVNGFMFLGEGGARYGPGDSITGQDADQLTMFFLKGGWSYTLPETSDVRAPKKFGFTATLFNPSDPAGKPTVRMSPFFDLRFSRGRHQFGVGAAISLLTGTNPSNVSEARANLSYRYLGDGGPDKLPMFMIELAGSFHRLEPWNPESTPVVGVEGKISYKNLYLGAKAVGHGKGLSEAQMRAIDPATVNMPGTAVILTGGLTWPMP